MNENKIEMNNYVSLISKEQRYTVIEAKYQGNFAMQEIELVCKDGHGVQCTFRLKSTGLLEAFDGLQEADQNFGLKHWLLIDLDRSEWAVSWVAKEIERKYFSYDFLGGT